MPTTTVSKWGTGQGVHIPKQAMEDARIKVGDTCTIEARPGVVIFRFDQGKHRRVKCEDVTFEELFGSWEGSRDNVSDPWEGAEPHGAEKELWE